MEERQDLQQAPVSPEIIREDPSHKLKKSTSLGERSLLPNMRALHNTVTTSQTDLTSFKNNNRETLIDQETKRNMDTAGGSVNCNMTLIAQKKVQEDIIQRGYNLTYTGLPTDNHLETLATIHTHDEKQKQGVSAYLETKEEVKSKVLQEIGNEIIHCSSATSSSELSREIKTPVLESIFSSPIKSNRLFVRAIRKFLSDLDPVDKEDHDIQELCEEINVLVKLCSNYLDNVTKEERDTIRGKIAEIHSIQQEIKDTLATVKKTELHSRLIPTLVEASVSTNSPMQEEKGNRGIINTSGVQHLSTVGKIPIEAHIHNQGKIGQLIQFVGNTSCLPANSIQAQGEEVISTVELTKTLQSIYQQDYYAKLPQLFSEERAAIADAFVNVAILKEEVVKEKESKLDALQGKEDKQRDIKEIQDNRLQSHERLYEMHETIAIGALFAPLADTRSPRKLLLYGRAGIGKTVLCQYIVNQWVEKYYNMACFSQFQAVFWIQLRELMDTLNDRRENGSPFKREMLVAEMVTACCLRDSDWQAETKKQQLQRWLKATAESTLFILDGYDEIAEATATRCVLSDCLDAVLNETQYKPYVMLTSRPVAIDSRYSFDRRLECMGFIDKNIPVFVRKYLPALRQSNNCLTFLKKHPSIWGTAHVPIHLELICWLWSRGELSLKSKQCLTMAALYTEIVEKIGRANHNKHALLKKSCLYTCYDKESLIKNTIAHFANDFLSFLSFHAMQQVGVLLPGKKIKEWAEAFIRKSKAVYADKTKFDAEQLLTACLHLGLLKPTNQGGTDLFDHTYYFIHLSFQEFFAAKYYQQAFECSNTEVIEHFRAHKYTPSYQLTWWMTAGLLYQQENYSSLKNFFETLCAPPLDLIGIHHVNLLSHCLDECLADEKVKVVAQLTRHLAGFLPHLSKQAWLADTWGKTLLHCSNLLHAKSFQDTGLDLFKKHQESWFISYNDAALLLHLAAQEAIACLTNQAISKDLRVALASALVQYSELTAKQMQSLFACITDTTLSEWSRKGLIKALAQRSDLTAGQVQSLITCATDTTLGKESRKGVIKALAQRSDLTAQQVQSLFDCATDEAMNRPIDSEVYEKLAKAFIQHSDLTTKQEGSLYLCETYTMLDDAAHKRVTEALAQRSHLTREQVQSLFVCVTDTTIGDGVYKRLVQAAQHSKLTAEQVQSLFACITNTTMASGDHVALTKALAQRSDLIAEQVQSLFACVTNKTINEWDRNGLAQALAQRSELTAEQVQSLFACVTDTTFDGEVRLELAQTLSQRSNLTEEQVQSLFACVTDRTLDTGVRVELIKALVQCSSLIATQVQSLIAYLTDTTLDDRVRVGLAETLAQRSDLTAEQLQSLFTYVTGTTVDKRVRKRLAKALAQHSDLTAVQVQSLIACVIDIRLDNGVRKQLAKALIQHPDLTAEQLQSLFAYVTDTTLDGWIRIELTQALAQCSELTTEQVQSLFACITDTTLDEWGRKEIAQALAQHSELTAEQMQSLLACVTDTTLKNGVRKQLAKALTQRSDLTVEQLQSLFTCVTDTTLDDEVRKRLAQALAQHSDLTAVHVQSLLACVTDTTLDDGVRKQLAKALVQHPDLTAEQLQSLLACVTDERIGGEICNILAQCSNFNVQQLQQILMYYLENEKIYNKHPVSIFSILRTYYSTNQIEQHTILSGLSTFLIRPSTWFALAEQQALFLYDKANSIAILRLGTQTMKIPCHLNHNIFLTLSYKAWGRNVHLRISKNYPITECTLLSGQEIVPTTMMPSPALAFPMKLTQRLKNLIEDSMSIKKQYRFQLKRVNVCVLTITFISSNESLRTEGRQLITLQQEMEACLQTANLKNYECNLEGQEGEILKVTGDKELIDALADVLVRQGLLIGLAEVNKYSAFFKAQKTSQAEDISVLTCPMQ